MIARWAIRVEVAVEGASGRSDGIAETIRVLQTGGASGTVGAPVRADVVLLALATEIGNASEDELAAVRQIAAQPGLASLKYRIALVQAGITACVQSIGPATPNHATRTDRAADAHTPSAPDHAAASPITPPTPTFPPLPIMPPMPTRPPLPITPPMPTVPPTPPCPASDHAADADTPAAPDHAADADHAAGADMAARTRAATRESLRAAGADTAARTRTATRESMRAAGADTAARTRTATGESIGATTYIRSPADSRGRCTPRVPARADPTARRAARCIVTVHGLERRSTARQEDQRSQGNPRGRGQTHGDSLTRNRHDVDYQSFGVPGDVEFAAAQRFVSSAESTPRSGRLAADPFAGLPAGQWASRV